MASSTEICNRALTLIGQEPIITLDDSSKTSRLCKRFYESELEGLLRSYPWTFAIRRVQLGREAETPVFGFSYQFVLPSDCMRILDVSVLEDEYKIENNRILTNDEAVKLRYVAKVTAANQFDAQFIEVLALRLAILMCQDLTADQQLKQQLMQEEIRAVLRAQNTNAIETTPGRVIEGKWLRSRW